MLLLPVVNGCLAEIHDCSSAWSPNCAKSILRNWYLGHVNVTLRSQVEKKKKNCPKWAVHASKPCYETVQTGTAELVILPSQKTNKQISKQKNSCQVGLCHVNAACGPVPKHGARWFCGVPVLRHNFWRCICHVVITVIQCQVSGVFCMWYLRLPLRVMGTLLWNKISPDFCYEHSTDRNLWAVLFLTWVLFTAFRNTKLWVKCISHSVLCIRWPST